MKPGFAPSSLGLPPRAAPRPRRPTRVQGEPLEGRLGARGACALFHKWSFASTRTRGRKGEGTGVTRPPILSEKFATRNKNSNGNHEKGHLGRFTNHAMKRPGSSGPVPEDAYGGLWGQPLQETRRF